MVAATTAAAEAMAEIAIPVATPEEVAAATMAEATTGTPVEMLAVTLVVMPVETPAAVVVARVAITTPAAAVVAAVFVRSCSPNSMPI